MTRPPRLPFRLPDERVAQIRSLIAWSPDGKYAPQPGVTQMQLAAALCDLLFEREETLSFWRHRSGLL